MLTELNHLTLACTDLERGIAFYRDLLGFRLHAAWDAGAYLTLGELWLCLSRGPGSGQAGSYSHIAFSVEPQHFDACASRLRDAGVIEWKTNSSEGESVYFLDPDGHQLEVHAGDLQSRLAQCRAAPYAGMRFFG